MKGENEMKETFSKILNKFKPKKSLMCYFKHQLYLYAKSKDPLIKSKIGWMKCLRCKKDFSINLKTNELVETDFNTMNEYPWKKLNIF